jgi:hypothetical protein
MAARAFLALSLLWPGVMAGTHLGASTAQHILQQQDKLHEIAKDAPRRLHGRFLHITGMCYLCVCFNNEVMEVDTGLE